MTRPPKKQRGLRNQFTAVSPSPMAGPSRHSLQTAATHTAEVRPVRRGPYQEERGRGFPSLSFRASYRAPFFSNRDRVCPEGPEAVEIGNIFRAVSELCARPFCCFQIRERPAAAGPFTATPTPL